eukprot:SAG25_NODE_12203_length_285_cov_0.833333_1_plen_33_part_10
MCVYGCTAVVLVHGDKVEKKKAMVPVPAIPYLE